MVTPQGVAPQRSEGARDAGALWARNEQFLGQLSRVGEEAAHADEGAHDEDGHLHSLRGVEEVRRHERAVFGEGEGEVAASSVGTT